MSHNHNIEKRKKREICICDRPPHFRDSMGKGKLDSTPIRVPPDFGAEVGSSLDLLITDENTHPGPFSAAAFHPSSQKFFGIFPRRNTPDSSKETGGKVLMDDKKNHGDRFYKPRIPKKIKK